MTKEGKKSFRVLVFGRGKGLPYVSRCLLEDVIVAAYIDNYSNDISTEDGIPVIRQNDIPEKYDYIIISIMKYKEVRQKLIEQGVDSDKIVCFFNPQDAQSSFFCHVLDCQKWKAELDQKYQQEVVVPRTNNQYYEKHSEYLLNSNKIPFIVNCKESIDIIIRGRKSLVRFGDGEFELMLGRSRHKFQSNYHELEIRLKEVLNSNLPKVLVAIANNYGDLSTYTEEAADGIRQYLSPSVRKEHLSLLDMHRKYYDAYLSRPYIIYRDKSRALMEKKFSHIKEIWEDKDVLIVEGQHTRFGVGNDLLEKASSITRILAPDKDAFSVYDRILDLAQKYGVGKLVISILGPTATVLSYDLAKLGYWAIDIGQVDTEYEWYLRGVKDRCDVAYKTISEYTDKSVFEQIPEPYKSIYEKQIVEVIK